MAPKIDRDLMLKLDLPICSSKLKFWFIHLAHFMNHSDINFQFCSHDGSKTVDCIFNQVHIH